MYILQINVEYDTIEEGETIARTFADYWVVCRKSGHRSFFVVLNQKSANFAEINGTYVFYETPDHSIITLFFSRSQT